jgi:UDP-2-acetamido-2,6-beta-L-arabino-hexul-4-ose reductase
MKILITGADGFIGKNFKLRLSEQSQHETRLFSRNNSAKDLDALLDEVDFVFHFAGVNRPSNLNDFVTDNTNITDDLCRAISNLYDKTGKIISLIFTSSTQSSKNTPYGESKLASERIILSLSASHKAKVHILRLPNIFGKWSKPNYNSVVATFCHNIARNIPIQIDDPSTLITLVYIEDLIDSFVKITDGEIPKEDIESSLISSLEYQIKVGELASLIQEFKNSRESLVLEKTGEGLEGALYSTYVSFLPTKDFKYSIPSYKDDRGSFTEMVKTKENGQFSFFTAHPGVTRGCHYHNSKTEKFLVVKGRALFKFKNIATCETHEVETSDDASEIVESIPGWAHSITNIGSEEMIVILWANEILDKNKPDTYRYVI